MKTYKKIIIAVSILIILGIVGTAIAVTYYEYTPITDVTITSHSDGDTVWAGGEFEFACTTSTDRDKWYVDCDYYYYVTDNVTHTWSGP